MTASARGLGAGRYVDADIAVPDAASPPSTT